MLTAAVDSARLVLAGKLFRDTGEALKKLAIGAAAGAGVTLVVGLVLPAWFAALLGGAVAGFAQPILFKDLKYN